MRPSLRLVFVFSLLAPAARAQPPVAAPAAPAIRPVPPPGIALAEADRRFFEGELSVLAEALRKLKAKPEVAAFVPDVEIYYRAVDSAVRYGELFAAEDVTQARALLAAGRARAEALATGRTPWLEKNGPVALGYVSRLDGSVQPYGVVLPAGFVAKGPAWRLDAWFHGRGEKLSEVSFISGVSKPGAEFASDKAILLQPYGRYCNGSKFAGEVDFFEALDEVKRRFPIDDQRIVIRGFSLGGHSAWHIGAHHAADWAAVAPGAGFSESREFLTMFEKDKLEPTPWEATLWGLYDAPPYAKNLRNVPLVAYSGAKDKQKQAADLMTGVLEKVGLSLTHVIGPDTGHKYHPDAKIEVNRLVDAAAARGRDPLPKRVSLATPTLKYNRQAWLQLDGLAQHWTVAEVEGELGAGQVSLRTKNATALTVSFPAGAAPFFPGDKPPVVLIDGQRLAGPLPGSDRSWAASFHQAGGRWVKGGLPEEGLRKRHDLQGPIDDAFMNSFVMITPEGKPLSDAVGAWVASEQARAVKEWRRQFRGDARVRQDQAVTDAEIAAHNLILWGDPRSNAVFARLADKLPIKWTAEGIEVGGQKYAADKHALIAIYPNPLNPRRYVVLNSGFTFRDYDQLNNARQTPKLPDWAVVDTSVAPDAKSPGKVVAADFFDERWQLKKPGRPAQKTKLSEAAKPSAPTPL
jgi:hypothetical protein